MHLRAMRLSEPVFDCIIYTSLNSSCLCTALELVCVFVKQCVLKYVIIQSALQIKGPRSDDIWWLANWSRGFLGCHRMGGFSALQRMGLLCKWHQYFLRLLCPSSHFRRLEISLIKLSSPPCHLPPQLLIGFESGTIVQWDLRAKKADFRIYYDEVSSSSRFQNQLFSPFAVDMETGEKNHITLSRFTHIRMGCGGLVRVTLVSASAGVGFVSGQDFGSI